MAISLKKLLNFSFLGLTPITLVPETEHLEAWVSLREKEYFPAEVLDLVILLALRFYANLSLSFLDDLLLEIVFGPSSSILIGTVFDLNTLEIFKSFFKLVCILLRE